MIKKRVAIIFGGKSGEHEVSITSAVSVFNALDKSKYEVTLIGIDKTGRWLMPSETKVLAHAENPRLLKLNQERETISLVPYQSSAPLVRIDDGASSMAKSLPIAAPAPLAKTSGFDVIIPILHGPHGEDGTVQGLLELSGIPYVGSGVLGSALGMDKDVSRRLLKAEGIPVVPTIVVRRHEFESDRELWVKKAIDTLGLPFFVKPANMGSSVGVYKVKDAGTAATQIEAAFAYDTKVLIEKSIDARELECSVLGNSFPKASIVGEIVPQHEFYSYEAKYIDENGALLKIPAENVSKEVVERVRELSIQAFKALECRGLSRVDFFLDRNTGELYLNEINTIPGFTKISMYPKLWEASGLKYSALLDELIDLAIENHSERNGLRTSFDPSES